MATVETEKGGAGDLAASLVVLVVEDDVLVRMLACDILTEGGHHPIDAVNRRSVGAHRRPARRRRDVHGRGHAW